MLDRRRRSTEELNAAVNAGGVLAGVCVAVAAVLVGGVQALIGCKLLASNAPTAAAMSFGAGGAFAVLVAAPVAGWLGWRTFRTLDRDESDLWRYRLVWGLLILSAALFLIQVVTVATTPHPTDPYG
ncbi:MAG TPA: hypothetical protein VFO11_07820 [Candidatus Polarisedimenticolaceae bacterium]|nr:hypothetical protein [Candidatus Polarisedimenticolaceae bacterium]